MNAKSYPAFKIYNVIHVSIRLQPICWRQKKKSRNAVLVSLLFVVTLDILVLMISKDSTEQSKISYWRAQTLLKARYYIWRREDSRTTHQQQQKNKTRRKISKYLNWTGIGINVLFYFFVCLILTNSHSFGLYSNHRGHLIIRSVIIMYLKLTYATHIDNNIQNCLWLHA